MHFSKHKWCWPFHVPISLVWWNVLLNPLCIFFNWNFCLTIELCILDKNLLWEEYLQRFSPCLWCAFLFLLVFLKCKILKCKVFNTQYVFFLLWLMLLIFCLRIFFFWRIFCLIQSHKDFLLDLFLAPSLRSRTHIEITLWMV